MDRKIREWMAGLFVAWINFSKAWIKHEHDRQKEEARDKT